jgi:nitrogen fixation NifU-like protein
MSFDDVRELYQDVILDRSRNPRHMRRMEAFDARAARDNPMCGDRVEVRLCLGADGRVEEAAYEARGCAISLASADLMAEAVRGLSDADIRTLASDFATLAKTGQAAAAPQGLHVLAGVAEYPSRVKCATLPWTALVAALDSHRGKEHG